MKKDEENKSIPEKKLKIQQMQVQNMYVISISGKPVRDHIREW